MTTNEIANELLNVMFARYEEEGDLDMFNFESLVEMLGEPEGKINRALWLLSEDGYTKVWKIDNIAWESMLNSKTISYMEKCPLSADGKRITKYIKQESKSVPTNITFNISSATNSIIGTQQNATMNVGAAFDGVFNLIQKIDIKEDREALEKITCSARENKRFSMKDIPKWIAENYPSVISGIAAAVRAVGGIVELVHQ
ncbi:hypothetical protein [Christensenella tenuis]|uniref:AbiTii domain-containing protein n=1 Tax=Christensenella tenuis TaxID=2763033 RepID=A0ABR7EFB7_9FIRM|nr:hypothetical protein [Christensenella tenuis]MBC5648467.1 hypothetical protein [Christensenella tenuis]